MTDAERELLLLVARHLELVMGDLGRTDGLPEAIHRVEKEGQDALSRAWGKDD